MHSNFKNYICVYGAGKWGSALAHAFSINNDIKISSKTLRDIKNFIPLKEALDSKYLIIAISAQHISSWLKDSFEYKGQKILLASKGIEASSGRFLNEILEEYIPKENIAYLTGPSFASEVMQNLPTALVLNSYSKNTAISFQKLFPPFIKTYISNDVIGAEISGAYKNVLAIASGICEGLALGNNARASLISRGLVEMDRFGEFFDANKETFLGLSGSGDLILTATSTLSRNYRVGLGLADGKSIENILEELGEVAEGIYTTKAIVKLSQKYNIYTPIASEINNILLGKSVKDSLKDLLTN